MLIKACDNCGGTPAHTFHLTTGREMDGAGSMDDVITSVDLCEAHTATALCAAIRMLTYDQRQQLLKI